MKAKMFLLAAFLSFPVLVYAQKTKAPEWINKPPYVEDGVIFFTGYSAATHTLRMTRDRAERNAQSNLMKAIQDYALSIPSFSAEAETRSSVSASSDTETRSSSSIRKTRGIINMSIIETWVDDDGGYYVLCSMPVNEQEQAEPQEGSTE
ncbi:MAG: hypothetical protein LBD31_06855 [Treponema sp.]|jgi:hypothetical protein|nr:hypothetical protein [Treponema sp.]